MSHDSAIGFGHADHEARFERRRSSPLYADRGMVTAAHPLVAETGMHLLRSGGNAVDAAIASAAVASVVMPEMCGLGGDLFAIVSHRGAAPVAIQAAGRSARNTSLELMREVGGTHMPYNGPHSISVPGMVDAWGKLHARFGTKSLAEVLEPAIELAQHGYALQPDGAKAIRADAELLGRHPISAGIFLAHGDNVQPGMRIVQSDLARTLRVLASDGTASFYHGPLADRIISGLQDAGSRLDFDDFGQYETDVTEPYSIHYRGFEVFQTRLPSQGIVLLEELNIITHGDVTRPQSADAIHLMVEAKQRAFADRNAWLADDPGPEKNVAALLDSEFARKRFDSIDMGVTAHEIDPGPLADGDTTYLATADRHGTMVSLIQSVSSAFGSGIVARDTGVVMNNRAGRGFSLVDGHPNIYAPGKRTMHTLNCVLVSDADGKPLLVTGTHGGDAQPQWNMQALAGLIDARMDVQAAVDQPRWLSWPGTDPSTVDDAVELRIEDRVGDDVINDLVARGHNIRRLGPWGSGGSQQIIARNPATGLLVGGADSRGETLAIGY